MCAGMTTLMFGLGHTGMSNFRHKAAHIIT